MRVRSASVFVGPDDGTYASLPDISQGSRIAAATNAIVFSRTNMANKFQKILFTTSVKEAQEHYGSRKHFEKFESGPDQNLILTDTERDFIEQRDTFYMATAAGGQPYIQHRGGPLGFLKVLDGKHLDTPIFAAICSISASVI